MGVDDQLSLQAVKLEDVKLEIPSDSERQRERAKARPGIVRTYHDRWACLQKGAAVVLWALTCCAG